MAWDGFSDPSGGHAWGRRRWSQDEPLSLRRPGRGLPKSRVLFLMLMGDPPSGLVRGAGPAVRGKRVLFFAERRKEFRCLQSEGKFIRKGKSKDGGKSPGHSSLGFCELQLRNCPPLPCERRGRGGGREGRRGLRQLQPFVRPGVPRGFSVRTEDVILRRAPLEDFPVFSSQCGAWVVTAPAEISVLKASPWPAAGPIGSLQPPSVARTNVRLVPSPPPDIIFSAPQSRRVFSPHPSGPPSHLVGVAEH